MVSLIGGEIAQSVEQGTENPRVPGSIPGLATIKTGYTRYISRLLCFKANERFLVRHTPEIIGFHKSFHKKIN